MQNELKELLVFKRGGYTVKIDGHKFYSSPELNEKVSNALVSASVTKPVARQLHQLIYSGMIIPLLSKRSMLKFLHKKVFNPGEDEYDYVSGFWSPEADKIFLMVDSELNIFGYVSNDLVGRIMLHEMMHMAAHKKPAKFYSMFKQEMILFYRTYWSDLFSLDQKKIDDKKIWSIIQFLKRVYDSGSRVIVTSALKRYTKLLKSLQEHSQLDEKQFDDLLNKYIVTLNIYFRDPMTFKRNYNHPFWKAIYGPLFTTYKRVFSIQTQLMLAQELVFPSEIISLIAESKPSSKVYVAIKQM